MTRTQTDFARKLRTELDERPLSVQALARLVNPDQPEVARRNLFRWLGSHNTPSRIHRIAVARALGLTDDALFDDEEAAQSGERFRDGGGDVRGADGAPGGADGGADGAEDARRDQERDAA